MDCETLDHCKLSSWARIYLFQAPPLASVNMELEAPLSSQYFLGIIERGSQIQPGTPIKAAIHWLR